MIKAILFDFDGVLTIDKTGSTTTTRYIAQKTGVPLNLVKSSYYKHNKKLLLGELTHKEMWDEFCSDVGQKIDYQVLIDSFNSTALDEQMIEFVKELGQMYRIGLVTDNKSDRIKFIFNSNGLENCFDVVAVSAELHCGKEDPAIFQYVLDRLNVSALECVFIDNSEKNLVVPEKMGMKVILFDDENRDFERFKKKITGML